MTVGHSDTYGIELPCQSSIPLVSDGGGWRLYDAGMGRNNEVWLDWTTRFRAHVRAKGLKWEKVAEDNSLTESGLRHWLNDTRDINLKDFFKLCQSVDADPALILFNTTSLDPEQLGALRKAVGSILNIEATNPPGQRAKAKAK